MLVLVPSAAKAGVLAGRVGYPSRPAIARNSQRWAVDQLGPNALGEVLEPGRVADCSLGLLLPPGSAGEPEAGTILIVAPAALLHPLVPQPDGSPVYGLLTGHPVRKPGELVFVVDLTVELRSWPYVTWPASAWTHRRPSARSSPPGRKGTSRPSARRLIAEEALALERPATIYVREQLRQRLAHQVGQAYWR